MFALKVKESKVLDFVWIELTNKCNFECTHCYANSSPKEPLVQNMSHEDYTNTIIQSYELGAKGIQFIGGEPLLYPQLKELIKCAHDVGFSLIEVYTNISLLSDEHVRMFKRFGVHIATSYYSARNEVHSKIVNSRLNVERLDKNIKKVVTNSIPLRVSIILTGPNDDYLHQTEEHLRALGVTEIDVDKARAIGRYENNSCADKDHKLCGACGDRRVVIDPNGDIYPCIMSRGHVIGNVRSDKLDGIQLERKLHLFRQLQFGGVIDVTNYCKPDVDCGPGSSCNPNCVPSACMPKGWKPGVDEIVNGRCQPESRCNPWQNPCRPKMKCTPYK